MITPFLAWMTITMPSRSRVRCCHESRLRNAHTLELLMVELDWTSQCLRMHRDDALAKNIQIFVNQTKQNGYDSADGLILFHEANRFYKKCMKKKM